MPRLARLATPLAAALFAVGCVTLFWNALFHDELFIGRDLFSYYLPAKSLLVRLAKETGGIPQWNPYFASGQPFAANPEHELYHPMTALLFVLPFRWAFRLQVILPVLSAGVANYFFLRTLARSRKASAYGAITCAFGGYTLSTVNLLPILFAIAVLPAVLAFAVRAFRSGSPRDVGFLALSFGLECLAGEPSTLLMTPPLVAAALLTASNLHSTRRANRDTEASASGQASGLRRLLRATTPPALGLLLGGFIGAATLVPGVFHMRKTVRAAGLPAAEANSWSMPAARLTELVYPWALGHGEASPVRFWGGRLYPGRDSPFIYQLYPGVLTTLLAALALSTARGRRLWALLAWPAVSVAGIAVAFGANAPVWLVARQVIPFVRSIRFPEKFVLVPAFAIVVLAAFGADALFARRRLAPRLVAALAALSLLAAVGVLGLRHVALNADVETWTRIGLSPKLIGTAGKRLGIDLLSWLAVVAGYAGAVVLVGRRRTAGAFAVLFVTTFDLVSGGRPLVFSAPAPLDPPALFRDLPARQDPTISPAPIFHFASWFFNFETGYGSERPPRPALWGIPMTLELDFDLTELSWSSRARDLFSDLSRRSPSAALHTLRRRGVSHIVRFRNDAANDEGLLYPTHPSGAVAELRSLARPKPFAFSPDVVARFEGEAAWIDRIIALGASAADAVLLDAKRTPPGDGTAPYPERFTKGTVTLLRRNPMRLELDVQAPGPHPTLVALNQTWDKHWSAKSNGAPVEVLRTDVALTAVVLPPGQHRLVLAYRDPWVIRGLALSAMATLVALAATSGRQLLRFRR